MEQNQAVIKKYFLPYSEKRNFCVANNWNHESSTLLNFTRKNSYDKRQRRDGTANGMFIYCQKMMQRKGEEERTKKEAMNGGRE
jgi:hypothetical protein